MISYLEILALGLRLEPRLTGHFVDARKKIEATDGTLRAIGPKHASAKLLEALLERECLIKSVYARTFRWLETNRGKCDTCGGDQENHRSGMCLLCQAALQKEKKVRESS